MLASMNAEALAERSERARRVLQPLPRSVCAERGMSGTSAVLEMRVDCDADALPCAFEP